MNINEICEKEEYYSKGEQFLREVLRRKKKVKYESGKRIIERVRREYGERCLNILTELDVEYDFLDANDENSIIKMKELFKPLSDIKIAGRYIFKEVAENIDKIENFNEGTFVPDYEFECEELKKELDRTRRENEQQRTDAIGLIEKKYDLIVGKNMMKKNMGRVERAKGIIEKYCNEETERKKCLKIIDDIEKGAIKIEERKGYCSGEYYTSLKKREKNYDPILKAIKKAIEANDRSSVAFLSKNCSLTSDISIESQKEYYSLFGYSCKVNSIDCAVYLLKKDGCFKNLNKGIKLLFQSIRARNENVARFLIDRGVDFRAKGNNGWSLLHEAARSDCYRIAIFLIENGVNVNEKDKDGSTPLLLAALKNSSEVAKLLIEHGANINERNNYKINPLCCAVEKNNIEVAKLLIENGANVNERNKDGSTPLLLAALKNSSEVAKLLIEHGANVNEKNKDGSTPLRCAVEKNSVKVTKLLIENGAKIDGKDKGYRRNSF